MSSPLHCSQMWYPLSSVQRDIWFDQALYPDTPIYNIGCYNRINGKIDQRIFQQAITLLVQENDVLRLTMKEQDGIPLQSFPEMPHVSLGVCDCSKEGDPLQVAVFSMQQSMSRPFRMLEDPLFRYTLYKLSEDCHLWSQTYHHLVVDGWAAGLITQRVAALYNALLQGDPLPIRQGVPYREFIEDDAIYLGSDGFDLHRHYWQQTFSSLPEPLLPPKSGYADLTDVVPGAVHTWFLPREKYVQLDALAQSHSASVFRILLGLLYVYFTRVQDQEECVIGLPVLNRNTPAFKQTIGLFVNTIPVRFSYGREIDFVGLIRAITRTLRENHPSQRFPASEINRLSGVFQSGRKQLFDLSLSFVKQDYSACFGHSGPSETIRLHHGFEQTPLAVTVGEFSKIQDIQIDFSYNLAYFDAEEIERIQKRFMHLLEEVLIHPEQPLCELDILSPAERRQLLIDWNATGTPLVEACVHQLFEAQAAETPGATAVVFEGEVLTYAELNARANQLAHVLIGLGVEADAPVAIALERSPEMIVALLAVLKTGGAYVPLDPDYPAERLAFMLEDSGARILITREALRERLPRTTEHTLCLDADQASIARQLESDPRRFIAPDQLAYVIYTSGSTGKPKGVAVEQRSIAHHCQAIRTYFELTPQDRVLQFASSSFDVSLEQILPTLCAGAAIVLPAPGPLSADMLDVCLQQQGVTVLDLFPAFFKLWSLSCAGRISPLLRLIILGGDLLAAEALTVRACWPMPRPRVLNAYGTTETTITTTFYDIPETLPGTSVPIGRPIANTRIYVLDRHNQPTPIGVPGELHIGGVGLARCYLNRPELTAERFIPDPFSGVPGDRLYKTGDLVRYRTDGNLEFLGRLDHQVKIRGFRIELGEIEAALAAHPAIREAAVVARSEETGDKRLVAYLVESGNPEPTRPVSARPAIRELRTFLKATLPDYMLPAAFVFLPGLPLTPNGKVDRETLPEPEAVAPTHAVAPRDALEEILAGLWGAVLHQSTPGIHDNFFELGGHSLLATRMTSRLRDALGIAVPVRWIFEAPTIAELAERIRTAEHNSESAVPIPANRILPGTARITPDLLPLVTLSQTEIDRIVRTVEGGVGNVQDIYPLAPLQEGIFFHHLLQSTGDAYLSHALLAFDSFARGEAFIAALQSVIDRHDILRTAVVWQQLREPVQVVWRRAVLPVEIKHFAPADGPIAEQLVESCHPRQTRLDLTRAPLLRIVLAEDGERWLLLFLSHHLIMDHTTLEVMLDEILAHLRGEAERLKEPVPFRNFVAQARGGIGPAAHEAFFHDMLGDISTPTAPFGLIDVRGDGSTIVAARRDLPPELAQRLRTQARRLGATPACLCHLAWALVLSRCCGQDDVVFGTVLFGRMQGGEGVERALGMFINTLPIRVTCDARPVVEALRKTQQRLLTLMHHEHASLGLAQRCSAIPAPVPLFSSLLNYRHSPAQGDAGPHLEGVELLQAEERSNYPFDLSVDDLGEGFVLTAQVAASVDPDRVCAFMQRALESLVAALEEAPQTPLCELDILSPAERRQLLIDWNATATPPAEACVHQLFEAQAAETPGATAVVFEGEVLTYAELNVRANQLANVLIGLGVEADAPVAIALERSPEMIVALLAVLKAGGAYVPLDPDYPAERLAFMLEDSGAKILITREALRDRLPLTTKHTLCLDADRVSIARQPESDPRRFIAPEHLAYVIYTSGSTGQPKGVAVEHRGLSNLARAQIQSFGLTPESRVLQFASFSFDASVSETVMALCAGAALYLPTAEQRLPGLPLWQYLDETAITHLTLPPTALAVLPQAASPKLESLIVAGESCPPALAAFWSDGRRFFNAYGPTEATVCAAIAECDHNEIDVDMILPIGHPIANTRVYVLDRHNQPTPVGVSGELHIGGVGLARCYLNRPELTAERFIPDPFSGIPGDRLYKTGDLVRYRTDGNLEFLGRLDHQVKIRGFRIELGEIEAALAAHPAIREAAVVARSEETGDKRLVAYLVPTESNRPGEAVHVQPTVSDLRAFLKAMLPDYMLPAAFVFLPGLPLTPNGKVDRETLPEPEAVAPTHAVAPHDALEEILAGLWGAVLHQSTPGIRDNFFELGGHSLLATRMTSRLRDALGIAVPVRWIFEAPTIAELAERIRTALAGESAEEGVGEPSAMTREAAARTIPLAPRDQPLPLSFAQQRLWFLDQLEGPSPTYNMPGVLELSGSLNIDALHFALSEIVRRHESLRTRLSSQEGEPIQVITPAHPLTLPVIDLRQSTDPDAEANCLAREEALAPFDLAREIPLRAQLLHRRNSTWTLLLTLHHSAADGWSIGILIRELVALYGAFREGRPSPLPELDIQYADFALWQRDYLTGERLTRQLDYWRTRLTGAPDCLNLPTDRPRPRRQSYRGAIVAFSVEPTLTAGLQSLSRRSGATLFMTLLAAWANLLGRYSGEDDLVIGSPVANRTQSAIEPLIGSFVNTLVLRADLQDNPTFLELLSRLRHTCLEAYAHQELPFETLVESLGVSRNLAHAPLFQVMFVLQNTAREDLVLPGLDITRGESESKVAKFDLTLSIEEIEGALNATLEYATDLFDRATIERLSGHFVELLRSLLANPEQPISELNILPPAERRQPLIDQNVTATPLMLTPNGRVDRNALPEPERRMEDGRYRAPRDALEQQLVQIWETLLSPRPIGIDDDFFEIGGHSLLAVRLVAGIDKRFGKRLPVSRFFEFPTIAGIASLLRKDGELPEASCLVRIRPQGSHSPLFFLPGAEGVVRYLYTFAQQMDPEIPFFAFQARGLDGKSAPHASIEAMAEQYVTLLLEVQPHGPYFLAGHSFGGQVAFAMAQILLARGHEIGLLAVVDTFAPGAIRDDTAPILDDGRLLIQLVHQDMAFAREEIEGLSVEEKLTYVARRLEEANLLPEGGGTDHLRWLLNVSKASLHMLHRYKPESSLLPPIALFRASETMADQPAEPALSEDWGWSRYSSQTVPVHYVPGDHVSMMRRPHAGTLAQMLREAIGQVRYSPSTFGESHHT